MPTWLGKCLCIAAAIGVLDGHLMLAQSWAWATMLHDRAPEMGVSEALDSTFSGAAPCPMCCALQEERQEKKEQESVPESKPTVEYPPAARIAAFLLFPPMVGFETRAMREDSLLASRLEAPPLPPPRLVFSTAAHQDL
ncbi:MAG: hypothetical protein H7A51_02855 [Akkermansiaceae bacterium]|nr:hypothetical protein [Akkermansiaceae bacterium]